MFYPEFCAVLQYTGPGGRNCVLITADALPGEFMACSGLSADDVSFAVITGRDNYIPALKSTWMQYTPHALVLTTPGVRPPCVC